MRRVDDGIDDDEVELDDDENAAALFYDMCRDNGMNQATAIQTVRLCLRFKGCASPIVELSDEFYEWLGRR